MSNRWSRKALAATLLCMGLVSQAEAQWPFARGRQASVYQSPTVGETQLQTAEQFYSGSNSGPILLVQKQGNLAEGGTLPPPRTQGKEILLTTPLDINNQASGFPGKIAGSTSSSCDSCGMGPQTLWQRCRSGVYRLFHWQAPPTVPPGTSVFNHARVAVNNSIAARMMFYDYDFALGGDKLTPRGKTQLGKIARFAANYPYPVIVQSTPWNPELAEKRKVVIINELAQLGVATTGRVVVGGPLANGLYGPETEILYLRFLSNTANGGIGIGGGTNASGFDSGGLLGGAGTGGGQGGGGQSGGGTSMNSGSFR